MAINQTHWLQKLLLCSYLIFASAEAKAQITPDNTLGAESSRVTPNILINGAIGDKIEAGAQRGSNLFHSFSQFNINHGQRVYFANPSGVVNILTRVTGGNASNILGTLGVDGAANLFLMNPNGILFGKNASLDVRGSFVGTTANAIQFGNQGIFSATNPFSPALLTIQPSALLFNQINKNAAIQNTSVAPAGIDPAGFRAFGLRVPDGKSLVLVGGSPLGQFTITGRGSLPPNPLQPMTGSTSTLQLATLEQAPSVKQSNIILSPVSTSTILEAQAWVKDASGEILLVERAPDVTHSKRAFTLVCPSSSL